LTFYWASQPTERIVSGIERGKRNPIIQSIWFIAERLGELSETLPAKTNEWIENEKEE
jgi:hypothetical protein